MTSKLQKPHAEVTLGTSYSIYNNFKKLPFICMFALWELNPFSITSQAAYLLSSYFEVSDSCTHLMYVHVYDAWRITDANKTTLEHYWCLHPSLKPIKL